MKVEFKAKAYLGPYMTLAEVQNGTCMPYISLDRSTYFEGQGYPCIGDATIMLDLDPEDQIVASQRQALQASLISVREETEKRVNAILVAIGKL
jgi:hypothetical protein